MFSIIIPSRTASNLIPCIQSVRRCEPPNVAPIIVVDDGVDWVGSQFSEHVETIGNGISRVEGIKPFIFSRAINQGIKAAGSDDVVLLNDDAALESPGGFSAVFHAIEEHPEFGLLGGVTNSTGFPDQQRRPYASTPRVTPIVAFLCVFIPRRTINRVGLLDERFVTYGGEDVDYCRRVRQAGLQVGVFDGCYVDHNCLPSTFRAGNGAGDIAAGLKLLEQKWGDGCPYR